MQTWRDKALQETQNLRVYQAPFWLAGAFEIGGGIWFQIRNSSGTITPHLSIGDNDQQRMQTLKGLCGGSVYRGGTGSWYWRASGYRAAFLAEIMEGKAPSRNEVLLAFQNWQSSTNEERKIITEEIKDKERIPVTPSDYALLVKNPEFVAGVIDARAIVGSMTGKNRFKYDYLQVASTNGALLEALNQEYGGYQVEKYIAQGDTVKISTRSTIAKQDSYKWTVFHRKWRELVQTVGPNLKLRSYD